MKESKIWQQGNIKKNGSVLGVGMSIGRVWTRTRPVPDPIRRVR